MDKFITRFNGGHKKPPYLEAVRTLVYENKSSLWVSFDHIRQVKPLLADWLGNHPQQMLPLLDSMLFAYIKKNYPKAQCSHAYFRVT